MKFTKMQGLGNDYLYVFGEVPDNVENLCVRLSDRHFGAGSDGMIFISPSDTADLRMRIFNADGSEAKMCGNGIASCPLSINCRIVSVPMFNFIPLKIRFSDGYTSSTFPFPLLPEPYRETASRIFHKNPYNLSPDRQA